MRPLPKPIQKVVSLNADAMQFTVIQIKYATAQNISKTIKDALSLSVEQHNVGVLQNSLLTNPGSSKTIQIETPPNISFEPYSNSVVVKGTKRQTNEVAKLILVLDIKQDTSVIVNTYHLKFAFVTNIQPILINVLTAILPPNSQFSVSAYISSNFLVVSLPKQSVKQFDILLAALDVTDNAQSNAIVLRAWNGNAVTLSTILQAATK